MAADRRAQAGQPRTALECTLPAMLQFFKLHLLLSERCAQPNTDEAKAARVAVAPPSCICDGNTGDVAG